MKVYNSIIAEQDMFEYFLKGTNNTNENESIKEQST